MSQQYSHIYSPCSHATNPSHQHGGSQFTILQPRVLKISPSTMVCIVHTVVFFIYLIIFLTILHTYNSNSYATINNDHNAARQTSHCSQTNQRYYAQLSYGYNLHTSYITDGLLGNSEMGQIVIKNYQSSLLSNDRNMYNFFLGKKHNQHIRYELEYMYTPIAHIKNQTKFDADSETSYHELQHTLASHTILTNIYYDFFLPHDATTNIYFGIGLGVSMNKHNMNAKYIDPANNIKMDMFEYLNTTKYGIAWDYTVGIAFNINRYFFIDLRYQYIQCGQAASSQKLRYTGEDFATITQGKIINGARRKSAILLGGGIRF